MSQIVVAYRSNKDPRAIILIDIEMSRRRHVRYLNLPAVRAVLFIKQLRFTRETSGHFTHLEFRYDDDLQRCLFCPGEHEDRTAVQSRTANKINKVVFFLIISGPKVSAFSAFFNEKRGSDRYDQSHKEYPCNRIRILHLCKSRVD